MFKLGTYQCDKRNNELVADLEPHGDSYTCRVLHLASKNIRIPQPSDCERLEKHDTQQADSGRSVVIDQFENVDSILAERETVSFIFRNRA